VSHNPFDDFEFSEWVAASLQTPSTSLASSESSTNQVNWALAFDTNFDSTTALSDFTFDTFPSTNSPCMSDGTLSFSSTLAPPDCPSIMVMPDVDIHQVHAHAFHTTMGGDYDLPAGLGLSSFNMDDSVRRHLSAATTPTVLDSPNSPVPSSRGSSASSTESTSRAKRPLDSTNATTDDHTEKRRRNNVAAAKYRQKKLDKIEELEQQLDVVRGERDELRIMLAKRDAEVELLRDMLAAKR